MSIAMRRKFLLPKVTLFGGVSIENATLHVPANALENYKATVPWSNFGTIAALTDEELLLSIGSERSAPLLIQAHDGNIVIQGAGVGTIVSVHTAGGIKVAGGIVSAEPSLTFSTGIRTGEMVIVQVGAQSVKVLMK